VNGKLPHGKPGGHHVAQSDIIISTLGAYIKILALVSFEHGTFLASMDSLTIRLALWVLICERQKPFLKV